jgi:hypothetical protein
VTGIEILRADDPELDDQLIVKVDKPGDYSTYTLCLVALDEAGRPTDEPFPGFDPGYFCLDFSFKAGCPSDLDCKIPDVCPPEPGEQPEITYLAKDYASFRQLIHDRLSLLMPDWQERHVPDIGIALVELLAYTGDYLSYYQDAVATEAYLDTARQRISVRRHARLVDYQMHEGCNARVLLCLRTNTDMPLDLSDSYFITPFDDIHPPSGSPLKHEDLNGVPPSRYEVFEPMDRNAVCRVARQPPPSKTTGRPHKNPTRSILRPTNRPGASKQPQRTVRRHRPHHPNASANSTWKKGTFLSSKKLSARRPVIVRMRTRPGVGRCD